MYGMTYFTSNSTRSACSATTVWVVENPVTAFRHGVLADWIEAIYFNHVAHGSIIIDILRRCSEFLDSTLEAMYLEQVVERKV